MTDFGYRHKGSWRDGEAKKFGPKTYCVSYDQKNDIYVVDQDEYDEFMEWVAVTWERSDQFMNENESAVDYLDRIGVTVSEWQITP